MVDQLKLGRGGFGLGRLTLHPGKGGVFAKIRRLASRAATDNRLINGLMLSPPTVTATGTHTPLAQQYQLASGGVVSASLSSWVAIEGGVPVASNTAYLAIKGASVISGGNVTTAGALQSLCSYDTVTYSPNIAYEAFRVAAGTSIRFAVSEDDGPMQYIGPGVTTWVWTGNLGTVKLAFGSSKKRRIRAELGALYSDAASDPAVVIRRISVDSGYTIAAPVEADFLNVAFLGDSYTKGVAKDNALGAGWAWENTAARFATYMGWRFHPLALGGTGFANANGGHPAMKDRLGDLTAQSFKYDAFIILLGTNDLTAAGTTLTPAAITTLQACRAANPLAPIFMGGAWSRPSLAPSEANAIDLDLRAAFLSAGGSLSRYRPMWKGTSSAQDPGDWMYGTSDVTAPIPGEKSGLYISSDRIHVNSLGTEYLARLLEADARAWLGIV